MKTGDQNRHAPPRGIRLFYWFGIYLAAQVPLIPWGYRLDWQLWPLFPMAMEWGFISLVSCLIPRSVLEVVGDQHAVDNLTECIWWVAKILPWATYGAHLVCTLAVRKRRSFLILLWVLIGIVLLNIASCAYFFHAPPQ